jgi:hypothetical protein
MAVCYDRAAEIADARDKSYPQLMACVAGICQAVQAGADCDAGVEAQLKALIDAAAPDGADFWELINWADAKMAEAILRSKSRPTNCRTFSPPTNAPRATWVRL